MNRGITPVAGIIVIIAVAIIVAAVIGTVAIDVTEEPEKPSVTITETADGAVVHVEDMGQYEYFRVKGPSKTSQIASPSQEVRLQDLKSGDRVVVTGTYEEYGGLYSDSEYETQLVLDRTIR